MNKTVALFLSLTLLTIAVIACIFPTPTVAPTERPAQAPTKTLLPTPIKKPTPTTEPTPAGPSLGDTRTRAADGMVMVHVPAGEFTMGSTDEQVDDALALCNEYRFECNRGWFEHELPAHTVALDGFWIDRTEVTNEQYQQCVAAGACEPPAESAPYPREPYYGDSAFDDYPVIWVYWYQATAYCEWAGGRLPTEAEWEYAARGPEGCIFPWGDELDGARLNYCDVNCRIGEKDSSANDGYADTAPVGSYPEGASWCRALDMAGNAWEWTADWFGEYGSGPQENPIGPSTGEYRSVRGGGWTYDWSNVRTASRYYAFPDNRNHNVVGFRCAASPGE